MEHLIPLFMLASLAGAHRLPQTMLVPRVAASGGRAPATLIVGRASCGASTFLLTDSLDLVETSPDALQMSVRQVRGFQTGERPWGLACLADGSLWTMADPDDLAELGRDGRIAARVAVPQPRMALFGLADRLLYQELPLRIGAPALTTGRPRRPRDRVPWPGLVNRKAGSREDELTRNLVTCGLPYAGAIPCWFADDDRMLVSNGSEARRIDLQSLRSAFADPLVPIWDVALVRDGAWVLVTSIRPEGGHRVAGRLLRLDARYQVRAALDVTPSARLLVGATENRCVLLASDGRLMEVMVR
ncbi:MAG: hypothetical protein ACM3SQ_19310 [Betaproteobacteria bacterium]